MQVKIATEPHEWEQAFRLVAEGYRARGYEAADSRKLRFTPYHALAGTVTFVATHDTRVIATLTLVPDNSLLGLPLEVLYAAEIAELRRAGRRLVEVTSLADEGLGLREFPPIFTALMRIMSQYGIRRQADTWVITINPRHRLFYTRIMGFVPLGPQRQYASVQNHPAEAFMLDVPLLKANAPRMYTALFGEQLPDEALTACPMPPDVIRALAKESSHVDEQTIGRLLAPPVQAALKSAATLPVTPSWALATVHDLGAETLHGDGGKAHAAAGN